MISKNKKRVCVSLKLDTFAYLDSIRKVKKLKSISESIELALAVENPFDYIDPNFLESVLK